MNLLFSLPAETRQALPMEGNEEIWYAIPYDLNLDGSYLENSFIIVTKKQLFITQNHQLMKSLMLSDCTAVTFEARTGCGLMTACCGGQDILLARCSMKHFIRFSYVARGADMLVRKQFYKVESLEAESNCPKCGRPMRRAGYCAHCDGKSASWNRVWCLIRNYNIRLFFSARFFVGVSICNI